MVILKSSSGLALMDVRNGKSDFFLCMIRYGREMTFNFTSTGSGEVPIEIAKIIFGEVGSDGVSTMVCALVCKEWRSINSARKITAHYWIALVAENGYLTLLQWARANGCPWNALTCDLAA